MLLSPSPFITVMLELAFFSLFDALPYARETAEEEDRNEDFLCIYVSGRPRQTRLILQEFSNVNLNLFLWKNHWFAERQRKNKQVRKRKKIGRIKVVSPGATYLLLVLKNADVLFFFSSFFYIAFVVIQAANIAVVDVIALVSLLFFAKKEENKVKEKYGNGLFE